MFMDARSLRFMAHSWKFTCGIRATASMNIESSIGFSFGFSKIFGFRFGIAKSSSCSKSISNKKKTKKRKKLVLKPVRPIDPFSKTRGSSFYPLLRKFTRTRAAVGAVPVGYSEPGPSFERAPNFFIYILFI